jgi:hypothetical protein
MLYDIHAALLKRLAPLKEAAPDLQLRLMPNSPSAFLSVESYNQGVLLLPESQFDEPEVNGVQAWKLRFVLELRLPTNWNEAGMIAMLESACRLLIGYRPPHSKRLWLDRTVLDGEFAGEFWVQRIVFYVATRLVAPNEDEDPLAPLALLRRIQGLDQETDATRFDVSDPGPVVPAPVAIAAVAATDSVLFTWAQPEPMNSHDLFGFLVQAEIDGVWTRSIHLQPSFGEYQFANLGTLPTRVRVRAMWDKEDSEWSTLDV